MLRSLPAPRTAAEVRARAASCTAAYRAARDAQKHSMPYAAHNLRSQQATSSGKWNSILPVAAARGFVTVALVRRKRNPPLAGADLDLVKAIVACDRYRIRSASARGTPHWPAVKHWQGSVSCPGGRHLMSECVNVVMKQVLTIRTGYGLATARFLRLLHAASGLPPTASAMPVIASGPLYSARVNHSREQILRVCKQSGLLESHPLGIRGIYGTCVQCWTCSRARRCSLFVRSLAPAVRPYGRQRLRSSFSRVCPLPGAAHRRRFYCR